MLELLFLFSIAAEVGKTDEANLNQKYNINQDQIKITLAKMKPTVLSICSHSRRSNEKTLEINRTKFNELANDKQEQFVVSEFDSCKKKISI